MYVCVCITLFRLADNRLPYTFLVYSHTQRNAYHHLPVFVYVLLNSIPTSFFFSFYALALVDFVGIPNRISRITIQVGLCSMSIFHLRTRNHIHIETIPNEHTCKCEYTYNNARSLVFVFVIFFVQRTVASYTSIFTFI